MVVGSAETVTIELLKRNKELSSKEIHENISVNISYATVKRILTKLVSENLIESKGKGRGTKYVIATAYELL